MGGLAVGLLGFHRLDCANPHREGHLGDHEAERPFREYTRILEMLGGTLGDMGHSALGCKGAYQKKVLHTKGYILGLLMGYKSG